MDLFEELYYSILVIRLPFNWRETWVQYIWGAVDWTQLVL